MKPAAVLLSSPVEFILTKEGSQTPAFGKGIWQCAVRGKDPFAPKGHRVYRKKIEEIMPAPKEPRVLCGQQHVAPSEPVQSTINCISKITLS